MNTDKFTNKGKFLMLALDHRGSLEKILKAAGSDASKETMVDLKKRIIKNIYDKISGVLLDSQYGLPAYRLLEKHEKPYLLCIEKSGYEEVGDGRTTSLQFSVEELKEKGASGVKLLLYVNPLSQTFETQSKTAKDVLDQCRENDLPLFLELVTYGIPTTEKSRMELILNSIRGLHRDGVFPDVWKLEFPGDAGSCRAISEIVKDTPWILLTRGEPYGVFKNQLEVAMSHGASGFLAGRALWSEFIGSRFLEKALPKRFEELSLIVLSSS